MGKEGISTSLTVNEGTQTDVYSVANAGTEIPIVKLDVGLGSATSDYGRQFPAGGVGTSYGTLGTTGGAVWGTLVAASGAGTRQYVSGLSIVVASGTVDCAITNVGTVAAANGAGILARGQFTPGGGIRASFWPVSTSGTNGTLAFWMGGAGTAYFTIDYWQGV